MNTFLANGLTAHQLFTVGMGCGMALTVVCLLIGFWAGGLKWRKK